MTIPMAPVMQAPAVVCAPSQVISDRPLKVAAARPQLVRTPPLAPPRTGASADTEMSEPDSDLMRRYVACASTASTKEVRRLVWTRVGIQGKPSWAMIDSGSVFNIIDRSFYESLPSHPTPHSCARVDKILSGHNVALPVSGRVVLTFFHERHPYHHLFSVVDNFPVPFCLGAEFLRAHQCRITYGT